MITPYSQIFSIKKMTDSDFDRISTFIYNELGMKMPPQKKVLLEGRLYRRLRELNFDTYKDYIDFVFTKGDLNGELITMFDLITTNKTDFFRESQHFDFFANFFLKDFKMRSSDKKLKIWSAGCSSGEEVYTLAMVCNEFKIQNPDFDFHILGSDISSRMITAASLAIYPESHIADISYDYKRKYLLKSKDHTRKTVRITPELRTKTSFIRHNLMNNNYSEFEMYDVIFCRNVLIYFDADTQKLVIKKLVNRLKLGGYLFLGHSETVNNTAVFDLQHIQPSVYIKK